MGKRGPAGKPTKLRLVEGNPSRRPIPVEPPLPEGLPPEPDWVALFPMNPAWSSASYEAHDEQRCRDDAARIWRRVVPMLDEAFLVRQSDEVVLTEFAVCWARLRQAERKVSMTGSGHITATRYRKSLMILVVQLGLTPAARIRLAEVDPAEQRHSDPVERVFQRGT